VNYVDANALVGKAFAEALRPVEALAPSKWAAQHLTVPDGPQAGSLFDLSLAPYLAQPLDMIGPDSGVNEIAVMKSAQTGFTLLLLAALGFLIDRAPGQIMVLMPTSKAVEDLVRVKLDPSIRASPRLRRKVEPQTSRGSGGSTTYSKRFPGGSITLAISTSAADLRSKTVRVLLRDEIDQYPNDLDGQGSPLNISDGRLLSFLASGDWRKIDISTPTIKGSSKIEGRYEAGDQRRWHVPCPHCGGEFVFEFGANFRFERTFPYKAHYVAPCCGSIIEAHEKQDIVARGRWVATATRPGAFPSYHLDSLTSPFAPWDKIAAEFVSAGDDPQKLKTFHNLWLGLPYEIRGDAPDYARLMERREEGLPRGHVPARGLLLVAAADVQMRGIWVSILAFAPNRESWVVDAYYCDGSTEAPGSINDAPDSGNAFSLMLQKTIGREFPDAYGRTRTLDALGIDAGYRSHVVYATVRANQRINPNTGQECVFALDGRDGWGRPPMGTPKLVDIDLAGGRLSRGAKLWPVGTWPLKGAFYADLRKLGVRAGAEVDPPGYCHFPSWLDEVYFRQITAEFLSEETFRGRVLRRWKQRGGQKDNHWLDCTVYCMALAEYLGLSTITADEWTALARERGAPVELPLFRSAFANAGAAPSAEASSSSPPPGDESNAPSPLGDEAAFGETIDDRLGRLMKANSNLAVRDSRR
jgi:phage terminase large subunit GpA-like protein